jgi:hypothetical protein
VAPSVSPRRSQSLLVYSCLSQSLRPSRLGETEAVWERSGTWHEAGTTRVPEPSPGPSPTSGRWRSTTLASGSCARPTEAPTSTGEKWKAEPTPRPRLRAARTCSGTPSQPTLDGAGTVGDAGSTSARRASRRVRFQIRITRRIYLPNGRRRLPSPPMQIEEETALEPWFRGRREAARSAIRTELDWAAHRSRHGRPTLRAAALPYRARSDEPDLMSPNSRRSPL